jgi:hypothetical protein
MGNTVIEDRLRAARPDAADVEADAFDADLLARVQRLPVDPHRTARRRIAIPLVTAGATLALAAVLTFTGGPGGPSSAAAIEQAMHWFSPPAGTVLHVRSIETQGDHTTIRESWQSSDDPAADREVLDGPIHYEVTRDDLYDPTTNTIYQRPKSKDADRLDQIVGDPVVKKVRFGLEEHDMTVVGRERHNGRDAWKISLNSGLGRPVWSVWVSAEDGKPLELQDPGRDADEEPSTIRWETYEVLDGPDAARLTTLQGAHPTAAVVADRADVDAAWARVFGTKDGRGK